MPFDFNAEPMRLYGIWPQTPFPVEVSVYGYCQMACDYCFANRNRDVVERELNPKNSAPALFRKLDRVLQDPLDPIGFFLREKYPICFSNTTDPFQREEKNHRVTEAFLGWAKANRQPLFMQTRGADILLDEWERYAPMLVPGLDVVYLSICQMDDRDRKRHEPGAPRLERRWELARRLTDHGIPVIAACNPYTKEWVPDPAAYVGKCVEAGIKGIWLEALHFTAGQSDMLPSTGRELLPLANKLPMFLIGELKKWYAACEDAGLDFFPTPKWDAYFGHKAKHPECCDPAWVGGKTFDFAFRLLAAVSRLSASDGRARVAFGWPEVEAALGALGVPNPTLKTSAFWYPYNAKVNADRESWNARLGKTAGLWDVLRYFWNHPYESQNFIWYHPLVRWVYDEDTGTYQTDADGNLTALFDPTIKHHGDKTVNPGDVDWDRVSWPSFAVPSEA